ncbi:hypothetical protein NL676_009008 [Syzygium grande]|nr:hypothetical protein NL676_009008 [Syzygium grande]
MKLKATSAARVPPETILALFCRPDIIYALIDLLMAIFQDIQAVLHHLRTMKPPTVLSLLAYETETHPWNIAGRLICLHVSSSLCFTRDAEVEGLRERVGELVDGLERERVALSDVSGERDMLKVECVGLVEKAGLLKEEGLSEMEKVWRFLEGSFERLKLQNEKLVTKKEEEERTIEAAMNSDRRMKSNGDSPDAAATSACVDDSDSSSGTEFEVSENLKVIRITQCPSLKKTPDFSKCLNLKRLFLQGCTTLLVVNGSHSKLGDLKLTDPVGGLESLLQLDLSGTGIPELLASNENSKRLEGFCLDENEIREPQKAVGMLENKELKVQFWGELEEEILIELKVHSFLQMISRLPTTKYGLSQFWAELEEEIPSEVKVHSLQMFSRLPAIKYDLSHLQQLCLDQCGVVMGFPELPMGLKELTFSSYLLWTALDLSYLTNLVDLQIRRNTLQSLVFRPEAPKIEWIEGLSNLERLTIDVGDVQCPRINWASFSRLQSSVIIHWHNVVCIRGVVRDSELLERLSASRFKGLHQLSVFACPGLIETHGAEKLESQEALFIHRCSSLEELPDLSKLKKLRQLNLAHCPLQNLPYLHLPDTCHLMVEGCGISPAFDGDKE